MSNQIKAIIEEISKSKQISSQLVVKAFEQAMQKAYMKEFPEENCEVKIDLETGKINLKKIFVVVEDNKEDFNEYCEISLQQVQKFDKNLKVGDVYKEAFDIQTLERRVILHLLQVFKHDITIESNKTVYNEWIDKKGTIILAEVEKNDKNNVTVNLGKTFGYMPKSEANLDEPPLVAGKKYKFVIKDVLQQTKGWPVILSRASSLIVKDLLTTNIPEIQNGIVEIVKIARIPGFKSKVVVRSNQIGVDPIGSCIGAGADRIKPILDEMYGEKIEFVKYDEEIANFIANACNPAILHSYKVIDAVMEKNPETGIEKEVARKKIYLVIEQYKLALLIGLKGNNIKLLSQLLDADVEAITIEEANSSKIQFIKAVLPSKIETNKKQKFVKNTKFIETYGKYQDNTTYDVISEIDDVISKTNLDQNDENLMKNNSKDNSKNEK